MGHILTKKKLRIFGPWSKNVEEYFSLKYALKSSEWRSMFLKESDFSCFISAVVLRSQSASHFVFKLVPWTNKTTQPLKILKAFTKCQADVLPAVSIECSSSKKNQVPPAACSSEACCVLMGLSFRRTRRRGVAGEKRWQSDRVRRGREWMSGDPHSST